MLQNPFRCAQHMEGTFMVRSIDLRSGGKPLFGTAAAPVRDRDAALADELHRRLREKYRNYERAAARLELRGEHDAADLLRKAASRARRLKNMPANDEDGVRRG